MAASAGGEQGASRALQTGIGWANERPSTWNGWLRGERWARQTAATSGG